MAARNSQLLKYLDQLEDILDLYLVKKAPKIPLKWQNILVRFLPWITLIFLILSLPLFLAVIGVGLSLVPAAATAYSYTFNQTINIIILMFSLILEVMALPGLFKRARRGWELLYYSTLVSAVYNLLTLNFFGTILGTLISLYLIFQIRSHYK